MRDEFSAKTKDILAQRVGFRCSNPKCRKATSGPDSTGSKAINVGVAAHIAAASEGGPRFDASMTLEQRTSPENGIWLCQICAKLIDSDKTKYTREVLLDWRETAEHLAAAEVQGIASPGGMPVAEHSISFKADEWTMWRNRGNLPHDAVVVIEGWARGDVRYSVRLRLRNNLTHEEVLHRLRMEFVGDLVILSDENAFDGNDVVLPPGKWVTLDVSYGLHDFSVFERSQTVWFRAESVGGSEVLRWQVAEIDHNSVKFPLE